MEYIAASQPMHGCCYNVGVALYRFVDPVLTMDWWKHLLADYDVTEVRVSEAKDWVAAATSSGTEMCLLDLASGNESPRYNTPGKEQFAVDGDDNLNYVIGANQAWSPPYAWFILENLGASGYDVVAEGTMNGPINDLDSNHDASLLAFGSDTGEFLLLSRSNGTVETVFDESAPGLIDAIEIGDRTLLVGGAGFIKLYGLVIEVEIDIKPMGWPNPLNVRAKGVLPVAILGTADFDVSQVDPATVLLEGVAPLRWALEDVGTADDPLAGPDGSTDLSLKFDTREIGSVLGAVDDGDNVVLHLTGNLKPEFGGTPISGQDVVLIIKKK
jgi:hypothetical protein